MIWQNRVSPPLRKVDEPIYKAIEAANEEPGCDMSTGFLHSQTRLIMMGNLESFGAQEISSVEAIG